MPSFIWAPKYLKHSNETYDGLFHITDWFPTLLTAANGGVPIDGIPEDIDGIDQWDSVVNNSASPREEILYNIFPRASNASANESDPSEHMGAAIRQLPDQKKCSSRNVKKYFFFCFQKRTI